LRISRSPEDYHGSDEVGELMQNFRDFPGARLSTSERDFLFRDPQSIEKVHKVLLVFTEGFLVRID
jgi:hypothetical protein